MDRSFSTRIHSVDLGSARNADGTGCETSNSSGTTSPGILDHAIARTMKRLTPFLMLMYVVSFLDRANISFAKQALQTSVGITEGTYALGAGLFFISYSLCGFPSNLILHKLAPGDGWPS